MKELKEILRIGNLTDETLSKSLDVYGLKAARIINLWKRKKKIEGVAQVIGTLCSSSLPRAPREDRTPDPWFTRPVL